jgi:hypothetical protein
MFKKTLLATLLMSAFGVQSAPLVLDGDFIKIGVNDIGTLGSNGNTFVVKSSNDGNAY